MLDTYTANASGAHLRVATVISGYGKWFPFQPREALVHVLADARVWCAASGVSFNSLIEDSYNREGELLADDLAA